jgi:hypothetical protein
MIRQFLSNKNKNATVPITKKFSELNKAFPIRSSTERWAGVKADDALQCRSARSSSQEENQNYAAHALMCTYSANCYSETRFLISVLQKFWPPPKLPNFVNSF